MAVHRTQQIIHLIKKENKTAGGLGGGGGGVRGRSTLKTCIIVVITPQGVSLFTVITPQGVSLFTVSLQSKESLTAIPGH